MANSILSLIFSKQHDVTDHALTGIVPSSTMIEHSMLQYNMS